jgi:hypothetical protein
MFISHFPYIYAFLLHAFLYAHNLYFTMPIHSGTFVTTTTHSFTYDDQAVMIGGQRGQSLREVTQLLMDQTPGFLQHPLSYAFSAGK